MSPQYCGGFNEILYILEQHFDKLDLNKIINYAVRLDTATVKRLGWILEHQGVAASRLEALRQIPIKGYRLLDPSGVHAATAILAGMIQEKFIRKNEIMKPLRTRLLESRENLKMPWEVLERDYLLSWILAGISRIDILRSTLIFKGGTAIKKCYFGDYRFFRRPGLHRVTACSSR